MLNFEFYNPARIVFGRGAEEKTGELAKRLGTKALLHYGGGSVKATGVYDKVVRSLEKAGVPYVELSGVKPNPRLSLVHQGIKLCRDEGVDFVLAVGGGSVIDSAKAIAAGVPYDGDVWDFYLDEEKGPFTALPIGVVLTIPAAGSESSTGSVITNETGWLKRAMNKEVLIPKFAVMNPEFTFTLPPYQTACGASDILAHMFERYFTQVEHTDLTDRLLEAAMKTLLIYAPIVMENPTDYDARAEVMWTGTIAHNNLLNTGRIGDWASHNLEHELSGIYDIAHGAGLSIVFPAWMRHCHKAKPARFVQLAMRVFDVDLAMEDDEKIIEEMIRRLETWYKRLGLPVRMSDAGIAGDRIGEMAKKLFIGQPEQGNFMRLTEEDALQIYKLAL